MSTKMYNYRISKQEFWAFTKDCQEFYLENHPIYQILITAISKDDYITFSGRLDKLFPKWAVDLQLFDEGETYLIRVLENGYFFMKNADEWLIERVTYDNRTDVPPEEEMNRAVAEWCDQKIENREFLIYPLIGREDFISAYLLNQSLCH